MWICVCVNVCYWCLCECEDALLHINLYEKVWMHVSLCLWIHLVRVCYCLCMCVRGWGLGFCTLKVYHLILLTMRTNGRLDIHLRLSFWYLLMLKLSLPYPVLVFSMNQIMWINVLEEKLDSDPNQRPSPGPPAFASYLVLIESFTLLRLSFHMNCLP